MNTTPSTSASSTPPRDTADAVDDHDALFDADPATLLDDTADPAPRTQEHECVTTSQRGGLATHGDAAEAQLAGWIDAIVDHDERALTALYDATVTRVYAVVLRNDIPSPLAPESDEEKGEGEGEAKKDEGKDEKKDGKVDAPKKPDPVRVDLDALDQRMVSLPLSSRDFVGLRVGKAGRLFAIEPAPSLTGCGTGTRRNEYGRPASVTSTYSKRWAVAPSTPQSPAVSRTTPQSATL